MATNNNATQIPESQSSINDARSPTNNTMPVNANTTNHDKVIVSQPAGSQGSNSNVQSDPFGYIVDSEDNIIQGLAPPPFNPEAEKLYTQLSALKQKEKEILDRMRAEQDRQRVLEQKHKNRLLTEQLKQQEERNANIAKQKEAREREEKFCQEKEKMMRQEEEHAKLIQQEHEDELRRQRTALQLKFEKEMSDIRHEYEMKKLRESMQKEKDDLIASLESATEQPISAGTNSLGLTRAQSTISATRTCTNNMAVNTPTGVQLNAIQQAIHRGEAVTDKNSGIKHSQKGGHRQRPVKLYKSTSFGLQANFCQQ